MTLGRKYKEDLLKFKDIYQSSSLEFDSIIKEIDQYYKENESDSMDQKFIRDNTVLDKYYLDKKYSEEEKEEIFHNLIKQLERVEKFNIRKKLLVEISLLKEQEFSEMPAELQEKYKEKLRELFILDKQIRG